MKTLKTDTLHVKNRQGCGSENVARRLRCLQLRPGRYAVRREQRTAVNSNHGMANGLKRYLWPRKIIGKKG